MDISSFVTKCVSAFNDIGYSIVFANVLGLFGITSITFPLVIAILLFGSIFFIFTLKFINFVHVGKGLKLALNGSHGDQALTNENGGKEQISSLKALLSSVAGSAGLGNISGVAVAVAVGGPGATFWMMVAPFLTMALRYAEVYAGHKYREQNENGSYVGGPAQYMQKGMAEMNLWRLGKTMAIIYSSMIVFSSFGGGCLFQSNQAIQVLTGSLEFCCNKEILLSLLFTMVVGVVILGGISRIASFLSTVIPILIGVYFVAGLIVILFNYQNIYGAFVSIITKAFDIQSLHGGMLGSFIIGFNRIIIASETGLGTAPMMHANSSNQDSVKEGIISMSSALIDTFFVCIISALIVVVTNVYGENHSGILMVTKAFSSVHKLFPYIIVFMVPLMGLNVVIAWYYYGLKNCEYLLGKRIAKLYLPLYLLAVFSGGVIKDFGVVVKFTDIVNTGLAIPNVVALLVISPIIIKGYKEYSQNRIN